MTLVDARKILCIGGLGPVHSGLSPSCMDEWSIGEAAGARIGFSEESVTCAACTALWAERGVPKYIVRHGETNSEFLRRTGQR
jgi:hypothetical protein